MDSAISLPKRDLSPTGTRTMRVPSSLSLDREGMERSERAPDHNIIIDTTTTDTSDPRPVQQSTLAQPRPDAKAVPSGVGATANDGSRRARVQFVELPTKARDPSLPPSVAPEKEIPLHERFTDTRLQHMASLLEKLDTLTGSMKERRREVALRRAELYHHEAILSARSDHVRDSINVLSRVLLNEPRDISIDTLHQLGSRLDLDFDAFEKVSLLTAAFREEVNKSRVEMHNLEDRVYELIPRLQDTLLEAAEDIESSDSETESSVHDVSESTELVPFEVQYYHSMIGDYRISLERLVELEHEHQDDLAERQRLVDQDIPLDVAGDNDEDLTYAMQYDTLTKAITQADKDMQNARMACFDKKIDPDQFDHLIFRDEPDSVDFGIITRAEVQTYGLGPIDLLRTELISAAEDGAGSGSLDNVSNTGGDLQQPEEGKPTPASKKDLMTPAVLNWISNVDQAQTPQRINSKSSVADSNSSKTTSELTSTTVTGQDSPPKQVSIQERADNIAKAAVAEIMASLAG